MGGGLSVTPHSSGTLWPHCLDFILSEALGNMALHPEITLADLERLLRRWLWFAATTVESWFLVGYRDFLDSWLVDVRISVPVAATEVLGQWSPGMTHSDWLRQEARRVAKRLEVQRHKSIQTPDDGNFRGSGGATSSSENNDDFLPLPSNDSLGKPWPCMGATALLQLLSVWVAGAGVRVEGERLVAIDGQLRSKKMELRLVVPRTTGAMWTAESGGMAPRKWVLIRQLRPPVCQAPARSFGVQASFEDTSATTASQSTKRGHQSDVSDCAPKRLCRDS